MPIARLSAKLLPVFGVDYAGAPLVKEFTSPGGPTTGLAGYSLEGQRKRPAARILARQRAKRLELNKGDTPGHEFHGNQWTGGKGGDSTDTSTREFKEWFGNSKVIDAKGNPLVIYRGDRPNKTAFTGREDKSNYIQGNVFFSDSPAVAKFYTSYRTNHYVTADELDESHGLYRAYLSLQRPLVVDAKGADWDRIPYKGGRIQIDDLAVKARNGGHDGLIVKDVFDQAGQSTQFVAFRSNQIRLANAKKLGKVTDADAHEAAASPFNLKPVPTNGQARAGNYPKGHLKVGGLDVSIENPAGSTRRPEWPPLTAHYGYVRRTEGADGDQVDVFVRVGTPEDFAGPAFVIDQVRPSSGAFDEHKVMLGWHDEEGARRAYLSNYAPGWKGIGAVTRMQMIQFKHWLRGDTTQPVALGKGVPAGRDGARLIAVTPHY